MSIIMKKTIVVILILSCYNLFSQDCSMLKTGKFRYFDSEFSDWVIVRSDSLQTESNLKNGVKIVSSINWITDCHYILTYKEIYNYPENVEDVIGKTIDVRITHFDNNTYTCHVVSDVADNYIKIYKVE